MDHDSARLRLQACIANGDACPEFQIGLQCFRDGLGESDASAQGDSQVALIDWSNKGWLPHWRAQSPGRTRQYILDGMRIEVPAHLASKYQGAGTVRNDDDSLSYGYKAVWLQEIIDNKGVIVALDIAPINAHDLTVARPMVEAFNFEPGSTLIADRGFIDGAWITSLKQDHGVDVVIPLRHNMDVVQAAIATADNRKLWEPHPTRAGQYVAQVNVEKGYLLWNECPVLQSAALVRWPQKDGTLAEVLFVSTKPRQKPAQILAIYDQRAEIEESHRQMKEYLGIERLPSKKLSHVIFRILMGVLGFNLMALFLSSEDCKDFEQYSLKTLRQRRPMDPNPKFVIYTQTAFAVLRFREFMPFVLLLDESVRKRIAALFSKVGQSAGAAAVSGYD